MNSSITAPISQQQLEILITKAIEMKEKAYCPYSNFRVGCAILCKDGKVFTGLEFSLNNAKHRRTVQKIRRIFFYY
jgi:cytidine deaminase